MPSVFSAVLFLHESLDLDTLVEAVKFGLNISQTQPLASAIVARQDPAPGVVSDADIASYVKTYVESVYHPIGMNPVIFTPFPATHHFWNRYCCAGSEGPGGCCGSKSEGLWNN